MPGGGNFRGVFAKETIKAGEKLAIFGGHVMAVTDKPIFSDDAKDFAIQIAEDFVIGTKNENEIEDTDYFNHSCNPNSGIKGQIFLVAMRNIDADEEITFDYAMVLHGSDSFQGYEFTCCCGSPICRRKITSNDWKLPQLQVKYNGWFSSYLQEKIDKLTRSTPASE